MNNNRLRQALYPLLRTLFRALPLSEAQRDRLRTRLMGRHGDWIPPPARGRDGSNATGSEARLYWRADEAAIGHVPYKQAPLPSSMPATLVAFYLPQFHTFPENDAWWGKGFTEWRNVTRALPQFEGHVQPRLPADLGFYDLGNPQVMRDQAQLAAEYGIGAFCFYFYWFSGRTLMEAPLRQWLADDSIDLPFCLCWANENWARRWDGRDEDILIGQQHSAEDDLAFIAHIGPYLRDRRALKVDGKPMLLVYRPNLLPDARATGQRWREWCRDNGIGEIHLAYVQGFERPDPRDIGFDAAVEFPPNMSNPRSLSADQWLINPEFQGDVRDWRELAAEVSTRKLPDYPLYPGVNPGWDNEARRSGRGRVYLHASPRGYCDWLHTTIHKRLAETPAAQRLVFINAWNEWAEGAVLEPDARLGHAWLAATRAALVPLSHTELPPGVHLHVSQGGHKLASVLRALSTAQLPCRILITSPAIHAEEASRQLLGLGLKGEVIIVPNRGGDMLPFLQMAERLLQDGHTAMLKLIDGRSGDSPTIAQWRQEATRQLLIGRHCSTILQVFKDSPKLGMAMPERGPQVEGSSIHEPVLQQQLYSQLGLDPSAKNPCTGNGSVGWYRLHALRPLLDAHLYPTSFGITEGIAECNFANAIESVLEACCEHAGYFTMTVPRPR